MYIFSTGLTEGPTVNGGNWSDKPVKLSPQIGSSEEKWTSVTSASSKKKNETSAWGKDAADNGNGKEWGVSLVGRTWGERTLFPSIGKCLFLQKSLFYQMESVLELF